MSKSWRTLPRTFCTVIGYPVDQTSPPHSNLASPSWGWSIAKWISDSDVLTLLHHAVFMIISFPRRYRSSSSFANTPYLGITAQKWKRYLDWRPDSAPLTWIISTRWYHSGRVFGTPSEYLSLQISQNVNCRVKATFLSRKAASQCPQRE